MSGRLWETLLRAASLTLICLGLALAGRAWIEAATPYPALGSPAPPPPVIVDRGEPNVYRLNTCTTDTECAERYGGDGGPTH